MINQLNWNQIKVLSSAGIKARYRKTLIGFFWVILSPVLMYSVQAFVFQKVLRIELDNYPLFLLGGLLPWIFISFTWDTSTSCLINSSSLLKGIQISPLTILCSAILDNFINFITSFLLILVPVLFYSQVISLHLLFLPVALIFILLFTLFSTGILSVLYVFYRDIKYVTSFGMSLLFFLTPIFYPASFVPENYQILISFNPIYIIISPFRASIYGDASTLELTFMLLKSGALVVLSYLLLTGIWNQKKNELYLKI